MNTLNAMLWCDTCREPHQAEEHNGVLYFLCPLAPPDVLLWVGSADRRREEG